MKIKFVLYKYSDKNECPSATCKEYSAMHEHDENGMEKEKEHWNNNNEHKIHIVCDTGNGISKTETEATWVKSSEWNA